MKIIDYQPHTNATEHTVAKTNFSRDLIIAASVIILPALILFTLVR